VPLCCQPGVTPNPAAAATTSADGMDIDHTNHNSNINAAEGHYHSSSSHANHQQHNNDGNTHADLNMNSGDNAADDNDNCGMISHHTSTVAATASKCPEGFSAIVTVTAGLSDPLSIAREQERQRRLEFWEVSTCLRVYIYIYV
jgi:hypothetical protein